MIDPIAGFRVNPSKPEAFAGPMRQSRHRVAVAVTFSALVIGLPVVAVAAMLVW